MNGRSGPRQGSKVPAVGLGAALALLSCARFEDVPPTGAGDDSADGSKGGGDARNPGTGGSPPKPGTGGAAGGTGGATRTDAGPAGTGGAPGNGPVAVVAPASWNSNANLTPRFLHLTFQQDPSTTATAQWQIMPTPGYVAK